MRLFSERFQSVTARLAPIHGGSCPQRRDRGTPPSDCTSRTRSVCRDTPRLVNMPFTCERIVLSLQPVQQNDIQFEDIDDDVLRRFRDHDCRCRPPTGGRFGPRAHRKAVVPYPPGSAQRFDHASRRCGCRHRIVLHHSGRPASCSLYSQTAPSPSPSRMNG